MKARLDAYLESILQEGQLLREKACDALLIVSGFNKLRPQSKKFAQDHLNSPPRRILDYRILNEEYLYLVASDLDEH